MLRKLRERKLHFCTLFAHLLIKLEYLNIVMITVLQYFLNLLGQSVGYASTKAIDMLVLSLAKIAYIYIYISYIFCFGAKI